MTYPASLDVETPVAELVPFTEWEQFYSDFSKSWKYGEHVGMIGPTGCGKTTLAYSLLPLRSYVTVFATKPKDESLTRFGRTHGYRVMEEWPVKGDSRVLAKRWPRRILWPKMSHMGAVAGQHIACRVALNHIYTDGAWCVYFDEFRYVTETLKLKPQALIYLLQARSIGITVIAASQRPAWIPLEVYDQSTHLFFWNERDERNLHRISGISSHSSKLVRELVVNLEPHEFLYLNTRTGSMVRSMAPNPEGRV